MSIHAETRSDFVRKCEDAGHKLMLNEEGQVDFWIVDSNFHNGPGCELCGKSWCWHCPNQIAPCEENKLTSEVISDSKG